MSIRQLDAAVALGARGGMTAGVRPPQAAGNGQAVPISVPPMKGKPKAVIADLARKTVCGFAPDWSGSMFSLYGDPTGITAAAAEGVIGLQRTSGGGQATVVPWGSDAPSRLAVGPLDVRRDHKALSAALRNGENLGGTNLAAGLRRLKQLQAGLRPDQTSLSFVFTDGGQPAATAEIDAALADLPAGSVHVCLVDRSNSCTPAMETEWRARPFGSFTRLDTFDITTMTAQLVDIYAAALGLTAPVITPNRKKN